MLELRTLGSLDLRRVGGASPGPISLQTKRLVLLAHLAASPARTFRRRDSLLALFWPELDPDHARGALRQALHSLRTTLGEGVILTRGESEIGVADTSLRWDAQDLETALQAGNPAEALSLYRGDFLEGVFVADASPDLEEWMAAERSRLRRLAARAAWAVAEGSPGRGEAGEAVRRAVRLSGDDEPALRRGIELLDRLGDHAGAIALFEEFARRVGRDLEVEPSAETRAAVEAIRARSVPRGAGAATPRPDSPAGDGAAEPPGGPPTRGWRQHRVLLVAGTAALVVLVIAALRLGRGAGGPDESDVVAVAPFRVSGADSSHAWMQEGMVDLLTIRLAGAGGVRVADAAAVISSWRRGAPDDPAKDPAESPRRLAADVDAEWVVTGSVVGTAGRVTLSARLEAVASERAVTRASVEGPTDSLPVLVDRLATLLLGGGAGLEDDRLSSLTSSSFPAVRAFLAGRAAFRRGRREEALLRFREAVTLDSSFALAGLDLARAAAWAGTEKDVELGVRRALAGRERLGPADRAFLDAWAVDFRDAPEMFRRWNAAVTAHPDRPETWYWLGDVHFHMGALAGIHDALGRAEAAFRRGWHLDSASSGAQALRGPLVAEPVEHMVQLAHFRGDTAEVRRLVARVITADASSNLARTLEWHRALLAGPDARDAYWAGIGSANANVLLKISQFITWTGEGAADYPRVYDAERRALIAHDPGYAEFSLIVYALNRGRPGEVRGGATPPERRAWWTQRYWLQTALWWEGDTTGALAVVRALEAGSGKTPATLTEVRDRVLDLCTVGLWHATRGDFAAARRAGSQLGPARLTGLAGMDSVRFADHATLCGSLIEAAAATGLASRDARARLSAADSLARHLVFAITDAPRIPEANLLLARLWEAQGDLPRALAAVRRRGGIFGGPPHFMTTFVREEGRLAALTGDTAAAIRAYRHYLGLRYDPEPHLRPEVERVRRELAILERR
jgi:serine/threonine-protein kinase